MTIRPATEADAARIAALWNPVIRDTDITFNPVEKSDADVVAILSQRAADGHGFFVAEDGGAVEGFATYFQFRGGRGYARTMEHTVILDPAVRGRGLGRALMEAVEDHARQGGAHSIFAGVSSGNPAGIAFHAALGYREVAVLPEVGWKFGRLLDLHLMQKILTQ
ncbi:GNAT family N-acetyltransferase [Psychromarinibacter halotolerans]|uniref:GNAT family N-acetyltransferase n=1 Tax=Psychromarinibacter halotolerans TaxID=1775175 RepID=A0ABV7GSA8_9RHOB|nr:GNAT family N-acetyltransferase [Psychromarinibacter halotolerans]MDF0596672.1 GNAT family N-acetyltransferase [Psychromarinibacter halotolerans]